MEHISQFILSDLRFMRAQLSSISIFKHEESPNIDVFLIREARSPSTFWLAVSLNS